MPVKQQVVKHRLDTRENSLLLICASVLVISFLPPYLINNGLKVSILDFMYLSNNSAA
jgi:hypothetical protein